MSPLKSRSLFELIYIIVIKGFVSIPYSEKFSPFFFVKAVLNPYEEIIFPPHNGEIKLIKQPRKLCFLLFFSFFFFNKWNYYLIFETLAIFFFDFIFYTLYFVSTIVYPIPYRRVFI